MSNIILDEISVLKYNLVIEGGSKDSQFQNYYWYYNVRIFFEKQSDILKMHDKFRRK